MSTNHPQLLPDDRIITALNLWRELLPLWEAEPDRFGISVQHLAEAKACVAQARAAFEAAASARKAAKDATTAQTIAMDSARAAMGTAIATVKSTINNSGDGSQWAKAGLMPRAPRGSRPAPTPPFDLSAALETQGGLVLTWKSRQPRGASGTVYSVYRGLDGATPTLLENAGTRGYTDETIPAGTRSVCYYVRAHRSGKVSVPSANLFVALGRGGFEKSGNESGGAGVKLAA